MKKVLIITLSIVTLPFEAFTLVRDYAGMKNGVSEKDYNHMRGPVTLENAYAEAFKLS